MRKSSWAILKGVSILPRKLIKKCFNQIGLDIVRIAPKSTLLGLKNLPIKTIIDIEANEGQFAKFISKIFPEAHIFCFEPLHEPYNKLDKWAKTQKGKVTTFNLALGDREGNLEMFSHIEFSPSSSFLKTTEICESLYPFTQRQISIPVRITTLDKWFKSLPTLLTPEILVKLDVQGYEDRVIRGGRETLSMSKACILEIILDELYENQATFRDIFLLLDELGYHYAGNLDQVYANDGHVIYLDAVFIKGKEMRRG